MLARIASQTFDLSKGLRINGLLEDFIFGQLTDGFTTPSKVIHDHIQAFTFEELWAYCFKSLTTLPSEEIPWRMAGGVFLCWAKLDDRSTHSAAGAMKTIINWYREFNSSPTERRLGAFQKECISFLDRVSKTPSTSISRGSRPAPPKLLQSR